MLLLYTCSAAAAAASALVVTGVVGGLYNMHVCYNSTRHHDAHCSMIARHIEKHCIGVAISMRKYNKVDHIYCGE